MPMKVGLFIPCYIDAFFPEVGIATLQLLERLGCSVEYPLELTCCWQPMANSSCQEDAAIETHFVQCFKDFAMGGRTFFEVVDAAAARAKVAELFPAAHVVCSAAQEVPGTR